MSIGLALIVWDDGNRAVLPKSPCDRNGTATPIDFHVNCFTPNCGALPQLVASKGQHAISWEGTRSVVFFCDDRSWRLAIRCIRLKRVSTRDRDLEIDHEAGALTCRQLC